jgi:hypothetical protein
MLKRDGLYVTFVHRSFQEYFCAFFLSRSEDIDLFKAIDGLAGRGRAENCVRMLYDMVPERVMLRWMLPMLDSIHSEMKILDRIKNFVKFINKFYSEFRSPMVVA